MKVFKISSFWIKICRKAFFLLFLLKIGFGFAQNDYSKKKIVIDPGHGGIDSGAIGINGSFEKDIVLDIAREIISLNNSALDSKFDIYLTRYNDTLVSLSDRSKLAVTLKSDLFVSLHCNDSSSDAQGIEVYVYNISNSNNKHNIKKSILLAMEIISENNLKIGIKDRGVKFANFQVLRETVDYCPGILIETGFISDKDEVDYLSDDSNIRAVALAILLSINKYFS